MAAAAEHALSGSTRWGKPGPANAASQRPAWSRLAWTMSCVSAVVAGCTVPGPANDEFLARSRGEGSRPHTWSTVAGPDWPSPGSVPAAPRVLTGDWQIQARRFVATGGQGNRTLLLCPLPGGPVRVRFTAVPHSERADGWIGDISVVFGAINDAKKFWTSGYVMTTGSYWNHCTTAYRQGKPLARTEWSPLRPGRSHEICVEWTGSHLRYLLDGQVLLDAWDDQPLAFEADRWIALRTWETRLEVHDIRVESGEPVRRRPRGPSPGR